MSVQATYDAERLAWAHHPSCLRLRTLVDVRNAVQRVMESSWWRERYPARWPVKVDGRELDECASTNRSTSAHLHFGLLYRHEWAMAHELAHLAQPQQSRAHGAEFRRAYVDIVGFALGRAEASGLLRSFRAAGLPLAGFRRIEAA